MPWIHRRTPLGSGRGVSRFSSPFVSYELIYLALTPVLALLEVQALARSLHSPSPLAVAVHKYWVFPVTVDGIDVVDFGNPNERTLVEASAQEMTGDWRSYPIRTSAGSHLVVRSHVRDAPTQVLGENLDLDPKIAGFLAPSAYDAGVSNLVVFANKVSRAGAGTTITRL